MERLVFLFSFFFRGEKCYSPLRDAIAPFLRLYFLLFLVFIYAVPLLLKRCSCLIGVEGLAFLSPPFFSPFSQWVVRVTFIAERNADAFLTFSPPPASSVKIQSRPFPPPFSPVPGGESNLATSSLPSARYIVPPLAGIILGGANFFFFFFFC